MKENLCRPGGVISTHLGWPPASRQAGGKRWSGLSGCGRGGAAGDQARFCQPRAVDNLVLSKINSWVKRVHPRSPSATLHPFGLRGRTLAQEGAMRKNTHVRTM